MNISKLLALAAIGTAVSLLFTTRKGNEIRNNISDRTRFLAKKLRKKSGEMLEKVQDTRRNTRKMASEYNV